MKDIIHLNEFSCVPSQHEMCIDVLLKYYYDRNNLVKCDGEYRTKPSYEDYRYLYCIFPFYMEKTCNMLISVGVNWPATYYINHKLLYRNEALCSCILLDCIPNGDNCFILQLPNRRDTLQYSIRLAPYCEEDFTPGSPVFNYYIQQSLYLREQENEHSYNFQLGNRNFIQRNDEANLKVYDEVKNILYDGTIRLDNIYSIYKNQVRTNKIYKLEFEYINKINKIQYLSTYFIFLSEHTKRKLYNIKIRLEKLGNSIDPNIRREANVRLYALEQSVGKDLFWEIELAIEFVKNYEYDNGSNLLRKSYLKDIMKKIPNRHHKIFYPSNCCESPNYFYLTYPSNLTEETPIILDLTYGIDDAYCTLDRIYDEDILHIFAPQIGHLLGNCMGETHFMDIYQYISDHIIYKPFSVFLIGYSNGAHAAWSLAEKYPDIISGIYVVSGYVNKVFLKNMKNIYVRNISSLEDELYCDVYESPGEILKNYDNYHSALVLNANHTDLFYMLYQQDYLKELLKSNKIEEPTEFEYYTKSNLFRNAYWVQLFPLKKNSREAYIKVTSDMHIININIFGTQGFRIKWPSFINEIVIIKINKQTPIKVKRDSTFIEFVFNSIEQLYELTSLLSFGECRCSIAEIYRRRIQIYTCDIKFMKLCQNLSKPKTFFLDMKTNIEYSIIFDAQKLSSEDNLIIIGHVKNICKYYNQPNDSIKFLNNGFIYINQYYLGRYNIICTYKTNNRQVLLIITNDYHSIETNIFLRLLLIPSFVNEYVSFINNQALIMYNNKYYSIFEWGNNIIDESVN